MAHAALSRKISTSLGKTELAMSSTEVCNICPRTWWMHSNKAFACGFLTVVGLCFIPYESHRCSKCNLNSEPLLYVIYRHLGYRLYQVLFTNFAIRSELLSKMSSDWSSLPLTFIFHSHLTKGSSTISNQLEAGSIMVRAIKSICKPSLPLIVYGPIRSTHKHSQGVPMTSLAGRCPYLWFRLLFIWQVLQCVTGWWYTYLSSTSQRSSSLRGECVQDVADSGDTTELLVSEVA